LFAFTFLDVCSVPTERRGILIDPSHLLYAQALATYNLLPIFSTFNSIANVDVVPCDISLAGRVLATFPDYLKEQQRVPDNLAYLGQLCTTPDETITILKLPNISASIPQLEACIQELRVKGYNVPLFPHEPATPEEEDIRTRYAGVLGSAVNPVIRQGNSDRHSSAPVKRDAQKNPNRLMKLWSKASRTHVAHMTTGDFFESEQSAVMKEATSVAIELVHDDGQVKTLKSNIDLLEGEVIDGSFMNVEELCKFYERYVSGDFVTYRRFPNNLFAHSLFVYSSKPEK
jgi:isocitrate dehydrogenase